MNRLRTIRAAFEEIQMQDPNTAVSQNFIRQIVVMGLIPSRKAGNRYLVNMEDLEEYLAGDD